MSDKKEEFMTRVLSCQVSLKAPKNQRNSFGGYMYRSCEDILEAAKPMCQQFGLVLNLSDEIIMVGDRVYVKATATLHDQYGSEETVSSTACARESAVKKGMDDSQVTGTASSYARKYALNGLFCIDDTKDADTDENRRESSGRAERSQKQTKTESKKAGYVCHDCGREFVPFTDKTGRTWTPQEQYDAAKAKNPDGVARCGECRRKVVGR